MKTTATVLCLFTTLSLMGFQDSGRLLMPKRECHKQVSPSLLGAQLQSTQLQSAPFSAHMTDKYGHYIENNFRALAMHATTFNGSIAIGSTYQMRYCYNNADKSKKDIYRVLSADNDLMLEFQWTEKNRINMGLLFSSTWNYRIQNVMNYPMIGIQLRTSPAIKDSYAVMPIVGFTNLIRDVYYGYTTYATGLYANYRKHNIGISFRLSELLEAFDQK